MLFSTYGPFLSGVLFVLSGLSVIALGELFIAVRENTLEASGHGVVIGDALGPLLLDPQE